MATMISTLGSHDGNLLQFPAGRPGPGRHLPGAAYRCPEAGRQGRAGWI